MTFVTQVLLPKRDNAGRLFHSDFYVAFQSRMIRKFRGWTRKGEAEGAWLASTGQYYADEHWIYEIGHARREKGFWLAEKERLKKEFEQEEIWIIQYQGRLL